MAYNRDTEVELEGTFRDAVTEGLVDPTDVTLEVLNPAGTTNTYTLSAAQVTRASVGVYTFLQLLDQAGKWFYRFKGTGSVQVAGWKRIDVTADPFA